MLGKLFPAQMNAVASSLLLSNGTYNSTAS